MVLPLVPIRRQWRISDISPNKVGCVDRRIGPSHIVRGFDAAQMKRFWFGTDRYSLRREAPSNEFYESTGQIVSLYQ
jgi:hypothetical protein